MAENNIITGDAGKRKKVIVSASAVLLTNTLHEPRIIAPERLSFAFGLQYMSTKILAHIPGPIIFGHLVDLNCVVWQKVCNKTGFCWIYDLGEQTKMIVTVVGTLSGLGILFFLLSWLLYKEYEDPDKIKMSEASSGGLGYDNKGASCKVEDTTM